MSLKRLIGQISKREDIIKNPPVLIDIGASGELNQYWKDIAFFSTCIAFDADDREFEYLEDKKSAFKSLIKVNKIVVDKLEGNEKKKDFYLTQSPFCSSLLEPDQQSLKNYHFSPLFNVVNKTSIAVIALPQLLEELNITQIDWFKTDSQGIDLRLFKSLKPDMQEKVINLEFEPGFVDGYKGEDKIVDVLSFMENRKQFFLIEFCVKGPLRISPDSFDRIFKSKVSRKIAENCFNGAPFWAEITYMNDLAEGKSSPRDFILAWLFSTAQNHDEIAYVYAEKANSLFAEDEIFSQLKKYSHRRLSGNLFSFKTIKKIIQLGIKKLIRMTK